MALAHQFQTSTRAFEVSRYRLEQSWFRGRWPDQHIDDDHHDRRDEDSVEGIGRPPTDLPGLKNTHVNSRDRSDGYQSQDQKESSIRQQVTHCRKHKKEKRHYEARVVE